MLPRINRLKGNESHIYIKRRGVFFNEIGIKMGLVDRGDRYPSRFGIIVSKKISKKAVLRNRIKRMLREVIKNSLKKIRAGSDILIIANPRLTEIGSGELERQFISLARRANILK